MSDDTTHATQAGIGTMQHIVELIEAIETLDSGEAETVTFDGVEYNDADSLREYAQEMPLDIRVRSGWHNPGSESEPDEYEILLSTGGPAVRIWGKLGRFCEPESAEIQVQDWFTPWKPLAEQWDHSDAIESFALFFYFGEG